jgi:anhydro-N-acetylmuramic acid kinase
VDRLLFSAPEHAVAALNLGGIANITVLPAGGEPVRAWDIGPANMVLDGLVARVTSGAERADRDGERARRGRVSRPLLAELRAHPYFTAPPPKSTGADLFGERYAADLCARGEALGLGADDLLATALALTVETVGAAIRGSGVGRVVASGGGIHNAALMDGLRGALPGIEIVTTAAYGIDPDAKEAIAFAILATQHLAGEAAGLPSVTGACHPTILGCHVPGCHVPGGRP